MQIEAKRYTDGWHTVVDGVTGSKTSRSEQAALDHGIRIEQGLARFEKQADGNMKAVERQLRDRR